MKVPFIGFAFIVFTILFGCTKDTTGYVPDCSGEAKTFSGDVYPVFETSCVSCHSGFNNYSTISGAKSSIRDVIINDYMPPNKSLSIAQKNSVICWIDNGAPNN